MAEVQGGRMTRANAMMSDGGRPRTEPACTDARAAELAVVSEDRAAGVETNATGFRWSGAGRTVGARSVTASRGIIGSRRSNHDRFRNGLKGE